MSDPAARRESRRGRIAKACSQCRSAKTRCNFKEGAKACDKCLQRGFECTMVPLGSATNMMNVPSGGENSSVTGPESPETGHRESNQAQGPTSAATESPLSIETASRGVGSHSPQSAGSTASHPTSWLGGDSPQFYETGNATSSSSAYSADGKYIMPQTPISSLSLTDQTASLRGGIAGTNAGGEGEDPINSSGSGSEPVVDAGDLGEIGVVGDTGHIGGAGSAGPLYMDSDLLAAAGGASQQTLNMGVGMSPEPNPEYFLTLGVFPEQLTTEMLQSRSQSRSQFPTVEDPGGSNSGSGNGNRNSDGRSRGAAVGVGDDEEVMNLSPSNDPMLDSLLNPVMHDPQQRFRFQNSAAYMVLQSVDPAVRPHLGSVSRMLQPPRRTSTRNVINQRILQYSQVISLFETFKGNYDHWISLPDAEPQELVNYLLEKCPLLVTTCCCVALRFSPSETWQAIYPSLVRYLTYELAQILVSLPQNIECLQALTILAKYADVLSYEDFVFDMWYISGIAIQHLETIAALNNQFTYVHMRLWNHLVLAHISNANITGRDVLVDDSGLQRCSSVLNETMSTRFDSCMVAELMIQWLTNQYLGRRISYADFQKGVADWQREWGVLAQLPIIQFIEPVLLFCCFLARWTHNIWQYGSSPTHSSPMSPPSHDLNLSAAGLFPTQTLEEGINDLGIIINGLLDIVQPNYFACLSDSLHNIGFISAVTAIAIADTLSSREPIQPEYKAQLGKIIEMVARLAQRFMLTSRGKDISRVRYIALSQMLKSKPLQAYTNQHANPNVTEHA